jgi:hypothetical protein
LADKDRGAHGKAYHHIGQDKGYLAADIYPGHADRAHKIAHYQHIRHIVKRLYQIGRKKGEGKKYQFGKNVPLSQVIFYFLHWFL